MIELGLVPAANQQLLGIRLTENLPHLAAPDMQRLLANEN